jgi:hypothetical protein
MNIVFDLTTKDLPSLKRFIARQFHDRYVLLNDEFFNWQYQANPFNFYSEFAMKIIKHNDEVVGYCGMIPIQMQVFETAVKSGAFANLMIDEKLRGFGFGTLLLKKVLKDYPLSYISGYSDELRRLCLRMPGWTEMGTLQRWVGILNAEKVTNISQLKGTFKPLKIATEKDVTLRRITRFDNQTTIIWEKNRARYPITINRIPEYLNWRYTDHPLLKYELYAYGDVGFAIIRIEKFIFKSNNYVVARVIDLIGDEESEKRLLRSLIADLYTRKVDMIDYFFSGNIPISTLTQLGFENTDKEPYNGIPMLFSPVDCNRKTINVITYGAAELGVSALEQTNWYITKGDGDQDRPNIPRQS